jgi:hypothetical protein
MVGLILAAVLALLWHMKRPISVARTGPSQFNPLSPPEPAANEPVLEEIKEADAAEEPENVDIFGIVGDDRGSRIGAATVEARLATLRDMRPAVEAHGGVASTTTKEDGTYSLVGLALGNPRPYEVVVSASGYAPSSSGPFYFRQSPKEVNLTLSQGVTLSGRVRSETGAAIAGARLSLARAPRKSAARGLKTETDADGVYVYDHVSPGEYRLYAYAGGHVDRDRLFSIYPGEQNPVVDFVMESAGNAYIAGIVVDEQGRPLPGARVEGWQHRAGKALPGRIHRWAYTGADGTFVLEDFLSGVGVAIVAGRQGYVSVLTSQFPGRQLLTITMRLEDTRPGSISGTVIDGASLDPVPEFQIDVVAYTIDRAGVYEKYGHILNESFVGSYAFKSPGGSFKISGLRAPFAEKTGIMETGEHYPTSNGPFYELNVTAPGYSKQFARGDRLRVQPGEDTSAGEIKLMPGATVTGTVYDLHTRDPIQGVQVQAEYRPLRANRGKLGADTTDELGRYRLEGVPMDMNHVVASHPDYAMVVSEELDLGKSAEGEIVDFYLGSGGTVEGRVSDKGVPIEGVMVYILTIDEPVYILYRTTHVTPAVTAQTDAAGFYRKDKVTAGFCKVSTSLPSKYGKGVSLSQVVEIHEGKTTICNLQTACEGGSVGGQLVGEEPPNVITGIDVYLRPAGALPLTVDGEGRWVFHGPVIGDNGTTSRGFWYGFEDVCPGDYTITAACKNESGTMIWQTSIPVTIETGDEFQLDIDCTDPDIDLCYSAKLPAEE